MRSHCWEVVGLGLLVACGGSAGSGGTTGGARGIVAAGGNCSANGQCQSGVCGAHGSGNCCAAACSTTDATCGATSCDGVGNCIYPSAHCGTDSCSGGMLTRSSCDGAGNCAKGTPAPCTTGFQCEDISHCKTRCSASTDCTSGSYCEIGIAQCLAKQVSGACTTNDACSSGVCGIAGTGNCCSTRCALTSNPTCGATGCDPSTAACVYPAGKVCEPGSCTGETLTTNTCDASGSCQPLVAPCPAHLACDDGGTTCRATCSALFDCASGFYCSAGTCAARRATGACAENDACTSGICGVTGTGQCCHAACVTINANCAAIGCDDAGACLYPSNLTPCGPPQSCTGATETLATLCDGMGHCPQPTTKDCSPYRCGTTACMKACTDNTSCASGDFCDRLNLACCSGLGSGAAMQIDGSTGHDDAGCCSVGTHGLCQTVGHTMDLIDAAAAKNVTIKAAWGGAGGDWTAPETYPIKLGWGVELSAPGVFFLDTHTYSQANPEAILKATFYSVNDTVGYASIVGTAANPIGLGMNAANNLQTGDHSALAVDKGNTLYLANANVNGSYYNGSVTSSAIHVKGGAGLTLGKDQSATVTGTVHIGNSLGARATDGDNGIFCESDYVNLLGCSVQDAVLVGQSSVVIQGQENADILAGDYAVVALTSAPVLGVAPSAAGFGNCPSKRDGISNTGPQCAIVMSGASSLTFKNGTVQCVSGDGFQTRGGNVGNPALTIDNTVIQNTDFGIDLGAGTATVTNSTIRYNFNGVWQRDTSAVDLSGGGNTVICSGNKESSQKSTAPGIDAYNAGTTSMNASNVAWDTASPDYFRCDGTFTTCTCNLASCTTDAGSDDMDAVEDSTNLGGITTSGATKSPNACQ
jgi:hypothetical protein